MRGMKSPAWGVFIVLLGVLLLLERFGVVHYPEGTFWPLLLAMLGVSALIERRLGSSVLFLLLAGVFLAFTLHWHGLSYARGWPLLMVAVGVAIVVSALTHEGMGRHNLRRGS
jgi:cell wall-active antibiotic response 4TMS protein YvqF